MSWLKTFTNTPQTLPTGWVECNGQTISDADSVYNGQAIPNLNGNNQFLVGNSTSGVTGGASSNDLAHTHSVSGTTGSHAITSAEMAAHTHNIGDGTNHYLPKTTYTTGGIGTGGGSFKFFSTITTTGLTGSTGSGTGHTHSFADTSDSKLSSTQENRPLFYSVVWIMRVV